MLATLLAASTLFATAQGIGGEQVCAIARSTVYVRRLMDLPEAIREEVLRHGEVAEAGQPFQESDDVIIQEGRPPLPSRRFVLAGESNSDWFVWIDHGGFARHAHVYGFRPVFRGNAVTPELTLFADLEGEPCEAINAFLRGVWSSFEERGTGPAHRPVIDQQGNTEPGRR